VGKPRPEPSLQLYETNAFRFEALFEALEK